MQLTCCKVKFLNAQRTATVGRAYTYLVPPHLDPALGPDSNRPTLKVGSVVILQGSNSKGVVVNYPVDYAEIEPYVIKGTAKYVEAIVPTTEEVTHNG